MPKVNIKWNYALSLTSTVPEGGIEQLLEAAYLRYFNLKRFV